MCPSFWGRLASVTSVWLLIRGLKIAFGRPRPEVFQVEGAYILEVLEFENLHWSFPSGHAGTAGAVTTILMLWFPRARVLVMPLGVLLAASRVAAEEHYPSDVVAGFFIGMFVTLLLSRWLALRFLIFRWRPGTLMPFLLWPQ